MGYEQVVQRYTDASAPDKCEIDAELDALRSRIEELEDALTATEEVRGDVADYAAQVAALGVSDELIEKALLEKFGAPKGNGKAKGNGAVSISALRAALTEEPQTLGEICKAYACECGSECDNREVSKVLGTLVKAGEVVTSGSGRGKRYATMSVE
jgi:hypothetical protein